MSARILARHDMHRMTCSSGPVAALGVFLTLPGPDIVEPEAAAATAHAAFAEAVGLVVFGAKFDAATEDCCCSPRSKVRISDYY